MGDNGVLTAPRAGEVRWEAKAHDCPSEGQRSTACATVSTMASLRTNTVDTIAHLEKMTMGTLEDIATDERVIDDDDDESGIDDELFLAMQDDRDSSEEYSPTKAPTAGTRFFSDPPPRSLLATLMQDNEGDSLRERRLGLIGISQNSGGAGKQLRAMRDRLAMIGLAGPSTSPNLPLS
jgi:hypothetical protein